ncbi:hypothetical protein [Stenotrophomonas sp.]|uniref:hypothetical protein n=1 Tax=Stenotrophomonas sp. TaxID=69392 RepID=UPI0028AF6B0B|nr:hypothetical protein [Stenotrophomonas sp.]
MGLFGFLRKDGKSAGNQPRLRVITADEAYGAYASHYSRAQNLLKAGDIAGFEQMFQQAWQSKECTPSGDRVYQTLLGWTELDLDGPETSDRELEIYANAYAANPSAFSAGLFASRIYDLAHEVRGAEWADKVSAQQWGTFTSLHGMARALLERHRQQAQGCFVWHWANYVTGLETFAGDARFHEAFEALWSLDRANTTVIANHANSLLPRWYGASEQDAEGFARHAIEATRAELGRGAYAAAYGGFANVGELDVDDTACDAELLKQAYQDLYARFDGLSLLNRFANAMSWCNDEEEVLRIFQTPLEAIDYLAWGGDDEEEGLEYAQNAYEYARDNA